MNQFKVEITLNNDSLHKVSNTEAVYFDE